MRALRAGAAYANVHTTTFGGGEIRGQIGDDDDDATATTDAAQGASLTAGARILPPRGG